MSVVLLYKEIKKKLFKRLLSEVIAFPPCNF